jgi:hypothetical protein
VVASVSGWETPPVPPGNSPFKIRGTGYLGHLQWVDEHFPGGREAFLAALSPPMERFFRQTFLAIAEIDFLPLVAAGYVCARVLKTDLDAFVEMRARHQALLDVAGVYRLLLKVSSAKMVASRLPKIMGKYFDFGEVRLVREETRMVDFTVDGLPQLVVPWFIACYRGYIEVTLGGAGGKLPVLETRVEPVPEQRGFPTSRLVARVTWA